MSIDKLNAQMMEVASFAPRSLKSPDSWIGHLPFAAWLIRQLKPSIFVELGTHSGNSYFSFCQAVQTYGLATRCYAVDTWAGDEHAGYYGNDVFDYVNNHNQKNYDQFSRLLRMTFDEAADYFSDASVELLHIDGLHTYEAVKHDFETWLPKMAPGAIVIFHDINVRERGFGVWKLWEELTKTYPENFEFSHSHGLGVIQLPGEGQDTPLEWLSENADEIHLIQSYFASLGQTLLQKYQAELEIKSLSQLIQSSEKDITELGRVIEQLREEVTERGSVIEQLREEVTERGSVMEQLRDEIEELDHVNHGLANDLQEHEDTISQLQSQLQLSSAAVSELTSSTSWRITSPMRIIKTSSIKPFRFVEIANNAVRLGGGYKATTRKVINLYRQEGVGGLKRGIQFVSARANDEYKDRNNYAEWIAQYDSLNEEKRQIIIDRINKFPVKPLVSVIMPVYNANIEWLAEAIDSVKSQLYPNWELCIADDKSSDPKLHAFLEKIAKKDSRIKVFFREENGHISAASNSALTFASGEWVALMDQDDLLSEHALFWVADAINNNPDARLIYSDEDKINEKGIRQNPYFKCDWNRDLFYSQNMISHLGVYHHEIVKNIGGFRVGFEGSQDHDLALRFIEQINDDQICHIPRVLYHWRVHAESTSGGADAKPYAVIAGEKALSEHFARTGVEAKVSSTGSGYRVSYHLPTSQPLVSLIIPTRNGLDLIRTCIESILTKTNYDNYEILIVDNGSDDQECLDYLNQLEKANSSIKVIHDDRPFNYSALNNNAVNYASGEIIGLINNDIEVIEPDWLIEMVSIAIQPGIGAVGAKLLYPDNRVQHAGVVMGLHTLAGHIFKDFEQGDNGYFGRANVINNYTAVTAACLIVTKHNFESVNGLNEKNLVIAFNDIDFCLKLKDKDLRNVYTPYALLYHHESATRGLENTPEKVARFDKEIMYMRRNWSNYIINDPCFSPNLSLDHNDCSLAWPPRTEV